MIRRRFFDLLERQVHYRESGELDARGMPLVVCHLLPGSARQMEPLIQALHPRHCIAPDLAGTGDSDPLDIAEPTIANYTADTLALIRGVLPNRRIDLFGSHTGACIALELARVAPDAVRRVVVEGVPMFTPAKADELVQRYAPAIAPDLNGTHLLWAHNFCRDQLLFYPWYDKSASAARGNGLPPPEDLHRWVLEVIKGLAGIPAAYRAAFRYPTRELLPQVSHPVLCLATEGDSLRAATEEAARLLPHGQLVTLPGEGLGAPAIRAFLDAQQEMA